MKKVLCAMSVIVLLASAVIGVNAHSGRTDGSGGHYNRSTGEYHYHHGYSAHDHYDMDGDGKSDCPYEFKNNTNHSSGTNNTSKDKVQQPTTETTSENRKEENKKVNTDLIVGIIIGVIVLVFWIAPIFYDKKRR